MNSLDFALEANGLGKRYRRGWALQNCSFSLPTETVVALVGPNGAGKSTLMALATGILAPTTGVIKVLGSPITHRGPHPKLAFLSQDKPLYRRFTVDEMLHFGRATNGNWDDHDARRTLPNPTFRSRRGPGPCPAVSAPGSRLRLPWDGGQPSCCSTSHSPRWIRWRGCRSCKR